MSAAGIRYDHLIAMSDDIGLFEHAKYTVPRTEHGYCVDDVARGLIVVVREPEPDDQLRALARVYLRFIAEAQSYDGRFCNRRGADGEWHDEPSSRDWWGRALWALGTTVARSEELADEAQALFDRSVTLRSSWLRPMTFAALGAAEVLSVRPEHRSARALLCAAAQRIAVPSVEGEWPWPESRLQYANAALPQVLMAAGSLLDEPHWQEQGLAMLEWLVTVETRGEHLSVTPVGGWVLGEARPGFDQQPIEVAALADACAVAFGLTANPLWSHTLERCAQWFDGVNDVGVALWNPADGSGCDGLERLGRNENCGAESTLSMLATFQQVSRSLAVT